MKIDSERDRYKRIGKKLPPEFMNQQDYIPNANSGEGVIQQGYNPMTGGPLP